MKKILLILITFSILIVGCSKEDQDYFPKGLVSFASNPVYGNGKINFMAQIQFSDIGQAVDIEYQLLDGEIVLISDSKSTENADSGLGLFFKTLEISVSLDPISNFSGKEITVWLDPENKVTASEYTDETNVNLWKKKTVIIP